jgi:tight adherence protein B
LAGVLRAISSTLMRGYVVRYRSQQRTAGHVTVTAVADGVPGTVEAGYQAPSLAPVRSSAPRHSTATSHVRSGPDFSHASPLSSSPSFAHAGSPATPPARPSTEIQGASGPPTALVAGIVGVLIALAIMLALHRPSARAVRLRVGSFIPGAGPDGYVGLPTEPAGSGILRLLERGKWWVPFVENVEIARSPHTPVQLVKRAAAAGAVFAVLLTLLSGSPLLGLVPLLLWPIPLRMLIGRAARKQREVFIDSLPGYLQDLASALRVGRSFAGALAVVAESADEPVHSELERAVTDEALGRPLEKSLEAVAKRMCATDMDQVALIAELNRRSGSNVAEALDRVADGARDRGDLRRETKALTGQAKMSSTVLTALPPLLLILISVISPAYSHPLFHTTLGIALLILSALMVFAGWKVMKKITMIKA